MKISHVLTASLGCGFAASAIVFFLTLVNRNTLPAAAIFAGIVFLLVAMVMFAILRPAPRPQPEIEPDFQPAIEPVAFPAEPEQTPAILMPAAAKSGVQPVALILIGLLIAAGVWYPTFERHEREAKAARLAPLAAAWKLAEDRIGFGGIPADIADRTLIALDYAQASGALQKLWLGNDALTPEDSKAIKDYQELFKRAYEAVTAVPPNDAEMKKVDEEFWTVKDALEDRYNRARR